MYRVIIIIQVLLPVVVLAGVALIGLGKPEWIARGARNKPFYPFRRWDWTTLPLNWKRFLALVVSFALAFGFFSVWVLLRSGAGAWSPASVSALLALHFAVLFVRIVAKRIGLGTPG